MSRSRFEEAAAGESWQVDAPVLPAREQVARPRPLDVLDEDEIIELLLKPSLWLIVLSSWRPLAGMALLAGLSAALGNRGDTNMGALIYVALFVAAGLRLAWGALAWSSRHYVLTNRRIMCFRGVLQVEFEACPLRRVRQVRVVEDVRPRRLALATIRIVSDHEPPRTIDWSHLTQVEDVFPIVARAVRRSQNGGAE